MGVTEDDEKSDEDEEEEGDELKQLGFNKKLTARTEKYRAQIAEKLREVRRIRKCLRACTLASLISDTGCSCIAPRHGFCAGWHRCAVRHMSQSTAPLPYTYAACN